MARVFASAHCKIAAALAELFVVLALPGCDPPGKGPKAELGYLRSKPVIAALARYRKDHGSYPNILSDLVPAYLSPASLPQAAFSYEIRKDTYELTFSYSGPGMNVCTYSPGSTWQCSGYF